MTRVLILSWEYPPLIEGGLARHVRKLSEALVDQDAIGEGRLHRAHQLARVVKLPGGMVGAEFGATGAPLVANVSIHGSFRDHAAGWAKNVKGMYLILHGDLKPKPAYGAVREALLRG